MDREITGKLEQGTKYAEGCRTSGANSMNFEPPKGPKPEPVKINSVPEIKERNINSKRS